MTLNVTPPLPAQPLFCYQGTQTNYDEIFVIWRLQDLLEAMMVYIRAVPRRSSDNLVA